MYMKQLSAYANTAVDAKATICISYTLFTEEI